MTSHQKLHHWPIENYKYEWLSEEMIQNQRNSENGMGTLLESAVRIAVGISEIVMEVYVFFSCSSIPCLSRLVVINRLVIHYLSRHLF